LKSAITAIPLFAIATRLAEPCAGWKPAIQQLEKLRHAQWTAAEGDPARGMLRDRTRRGSPFTRTITSRGSAERT
jgi:hypothetical protein